MFVHPQWVRLHGASNHHTEAEEIKHFWYSPHTLYYKRQDITWRVWPFHHMLLVVIVPRKGWLLNSSKGNGISCLAATFTFSHVQHIKFVKVAYWCCCLFSTCQKERRFSLKHVPSPVPRSSLKGDLIIDYILRSSTTWFLITLL